MVATLTQEAVMQLIKLVEPGVAHANGLEDSLKLNGASNPGAAVTRLKAVLEKAPPHLPLPNPAPPSHDYKVHCI